MGARSSATTIRLLLCGIAAIAAFALTAFIFSRTPATADTHLDSSRVHVGEDGRTYGVPCEGSDGLLVMPDMMRVRATNGNYGYLSNEEMHSLILDGATTEEEKTASIRATASKRAPALARAVEQYFGLSFATAGQLEETAAGLFRDNGQENAAATLTELGAEPLSAAINEGALDRVKAVALVREAAAADEGIALASISSQDEAQTVSERAEAMVDAAEVAPIAPAQISISPEMFEEIYQLVREEIGVQVPVYAEDGKTVVGYYLMGR